jgi:hypothetical protein
MEKCCYHQPDTIILGIGFDATYFDKTAALVQAKIDLVKQKQMKGVMVWSLGNLSGGSNDPRLQPLRNYVAGN